MRDFLKWVSVCDRYSRVGLDQQLRRYHLNSSQYFYIVRICENAGITQDRLSQVVLVNPSNVTRALKHLEEQGYIYRIVNEKDKRTALLYPKQKALDIVENLQRIKQSYTEQLFEGIDAKQRSLFCEQMQMVAEKSIILAKEVEKDACE